MRLSFCLSALFVFCFSSCQLMGKHVAGNGKIISQQRTVGAFSSVDVSGSIKVHVRQDVAPGVKIETDENLMEYIEVEVNGSKLEIHTKNNVNLDPSKEIIAWVSAPAYKNIEVSGACDIIGDAPITGSEQLSMHVSGSGDITMEVGLPKVSTEISGSGSVNLKGQATDFDAQVSGSGDVKCFGLVTDNTSLDLSGAASAEVYANKKLNVEVSGSGTVLYKGSASVSQTISGSGSVKKAE